MATFNKDKLTLLPQSVAGFRMWHYTDTGLLVADVQEVNGFFTTGHQCGMRKGDFVHITEGDTGAYNAADTSGRRHYGTTVIISQDTGVTQTTIGLCTLIGDTS